MGFARERGVAGALIDRQECLSYFLRWRRT